MIKESLFNKIQKSGLVSMSQSDDPYFSWQGCDWCNTVTKKVLGATVYDCIGATTLKQAQRKKFYEFRLCGDCLYNIVNGFPNET